MPLITVRTNMSVEADQANSLLRVCSAELAKQLGKPEHYVMTLFEKVDAMTMSGTDAPACLVEIRSVGTITPTQSKNMSEAFTALLHERLGMATDRIYIQFEAVAGAMWGYDGRTFG